MRPSARSRRFGSVNDDPLGSNVAASVKTVIAWDIWPSRVKGMLIGIVEYPFWVVRCVTIRLKRDWTEGAAWETQAWGMPRSLGLGGFERRDKGDGEGK